MARQFFVWNVLGETVSAAAKPFFQELTNAVNAIFPAVPLSPEELATMVARGHFGISLAIDEAKKSGVSENDFRLMVVNATTVPALGDMLRLFREEKVSQSALEDVIQKTGFANEWVPTLLKLGVQPPSPTDILDALLQGQIDDTAAHDLYRKLGGDPDYFQLLFDSRGSAPTPVEAA